MKTRAAITAMALLSSSFTPLSLMTTAASAAVVPAADPNAPDMAAVCAAYVTGQDPQFYRANVIDANTDTGPSAPIAGSEEHVNFQADTTNPLGWSYVGFLGTSGTLTRNGGSPNLWALATFDHSEWDNTLYDVQMGFQHDVTYTWTCEIQQNIDNPTFVPDPPAPPPPPQNNGTCNNNGQGGGNAQNNNNQQDGGNGGGNQGCGNGNGGSDTTTSGDSGTNGGQGDHGCGAGGEATQDDVYAGNSDHICKDGQPGTVVHHWSWQTTDTKPQLVTNTNIYDGKDITAEDLFQAGHVSGVNYLKQSGPLTSDARILSCISPGSKGGTWKAKLYYLGGDAACAAAGKVFSTLTYGNGRNFGDPPTNSLPTINP